MKTPTLFDMAFNENDTITCVSALIYAMIGGYETGHRLHECGLLSKSSIN